MSAQVFRSLRRELGVLALPVLEVVVHALQRLLQVDTGDLAKVDIHIGDDEPHETRLSRGQRPWFVRLDAVKPFTDREPGLSFCVTLGMELE